MTSTPGEPGKPPGGKGQPAWLFPVTFGVAFAAATLAGELLQDAVGIAGRVLITGALVFLIVLAARLLFGPPG